MLLQLLDADYILNSNKPIIRLFGKTEQGNPVCVFYDNFRPYFYARQPVEGPEISNAEEIEKFVPIGFHQSPDKLFKITLANPQDVSKVRERSEQSGNETFEADILFKYRFLVDKGIKGMGWLAIDGERAFTKTVKCMAYHAKEVRPVEKRENSPLRYLSFDIECIPADVTKPLNPKKDSIVMIALSFAPKYKNLESLVLVAKPASANGVEGFNGEKEMLQAFLEIVDSYDPDIMTGYNINAFDIPYLLERLEKNGLQKYFGRATDKSVYTQTFGMTQESVIPGRIVVDSYQLIRRDAWVKFHRYDLNTVAKAMLGEEKLDVEYGAMPGLWNGSRENLTKFIEYARKDAELSMRLVLEKHLLDKFFELSKISGVLLQDAFGGQSQRIEVMLLHEFKKRNFVMPTKPSRTEMSKRLKERDKQGLQGATVLEPKKGLHASGCTLVLDFKSLYPSLMMAYNISPDTLLTDPGIECSVSPTGARFIKKEMREGILPYVLKQLLETRQEIKKIMKTSRGEERRILNAKQLAVKDISNSIYGYTGYVRARLYVFDVASSITAYGRENIEKTKKLVEENFPVEVVYGDTDSLFVKTKLTNLDEAKEIGEKISQLVSSKLGGKLQLEFEKIYCTFLILTKKRYAGWKFSYDDGWKDDIEMKGIETIRRDWCPLVSETMSAILNTILKEGDVQKSIAQLRSVVEQLKKGEIPLEKLTVVKGITKSVDSYEGMLPHIELAKKLVQRNPQGVKVGDRLGFVIIKGNAILSKRAEEPEYAKKHKLAIDSDYYIHSQLFPPIERILSALGITKSELLGSGRQFSLSDIVNGSKRKTKHEITVSYNNLQKEENKEPLKGYEGFVCQRCQRSYRRPPLQNTCECGGELLFAYQGSVGNRVVEK